LWSENLSDFAHLWGFVTAPANATSFYIEIRTRRTSTALATDLYVSQPYIGRASSAQTMPTQWVNGDTIISSSNASTYIANAAIGTAQIGTAAIKTAQIEDLAVSSAKISSLALTGTSNFSVKSGTAGARMEMNSRAIKVFDASGVLRVQIGDLTA
jgi:hypothetical protein